MSTDDSLASGGKRRRRESTPAQRALGLLVRREHSRQELSRKLVARGIAADEAAAAVDRMTAAGWQDERRFATMLARTRATHGYGPLRIRAELASHGLDHDTIAAAFAALAEAGEDDWRARARDLVRRRVGPAIANSMAMRRKAADLLIRRGFDGDSMRAALRDPGDD
ncbi:MAG TPA: regulatory protein RecX [Luteimonas sp.]|nr:regulatory protein RecX [Luteimonas sp.]